MAATLGVSIDATRMVATMVDASSEVCGREQLTLGSDTPPKRVVLQVAELVQRFDASALAPAAVGIGFPGLVDHERGWIRSSTLFAGWREVRLARAIEARIGRPCIVDNDVNLAAIAERHRGVAAGSSSFALLWFGAGLGCAIDLGDSLWRGVSGGAGELGYVPIGKPGWDLQDVAGGPAVLALAAEHGYSAQTAEEAVALAVSKVDRKFLGELATRIALALAAVAAILDPPLVVLAGEVAQAGGGLLRDLVEEAFHGATPLRTPIAVTALHDDAVLLGALDAGLRAVRDSLIDSLRHALTPAQ